MIIDTTERMTTGREEFDWFIWGILFSLYPQKFNLEFINKIHVNLIIYILWLQYERSDILYNCTHFDYVMITYQKYRSFDVSAGIQTGKSKNK